MLGDTAILFLALLFAAAAEHKLRAPRRFAAVLRDYAPIPPGAAPALALALGGVELVLALALPLAPRSAGLAAAALLAAYGAAMAVPLARGRHDLDCGCIGAAGQQRLRPWLLLRNLALIGLALFVHTAAPPDRSALAILLALLAGSTLFVLALAAAQLPLNHGRRRAGGTSP